MQVKEIGQQALELWKKLSLVRRVALGVVLAAVLAGLAALVLHEPEVAYQTVLADLTDTEAAAVVEQLEADKVPYRLATRDGMTRVEVPEKAADRVRLSLSASGIGEGGLGFESLKNDETYVSSSNKERMLFDIALSKELAKTIRSIDGVRSARVHLARPPKSIYRKLEVPPSASVVVHLERGRTLSDKEVRGIVNMVANSVERLEAESVTVVDRTGKELWSGGEDSIASLAQRELERTTQAKIEGLLERVLGPDQYQVVVTAVFDRSRVRETKQRYDTDNPAVISEQTTEEQRGLGVVRGGIAGARGNQPEVGQVPLTAGATGTAPGRRSEVKNYKLNTTVTDIEQPEIRVKALHVAVMVNEPEPVFTAPTSSVATSSRALAFGVPEVPVALPRRTPDLGKLASMIRAAGGLDPERGDSLELATMPFYQSPELLADEDLAEAPAPTAPWYDEMPLWSWMLVAGCLFLLVLAGVLAVRRHFLGRAEDEADLLLAPTRADEMEAALEGTEYEPAPTLGELRTKVHELVLDNGDLAAEILSAWIHDNMNGKPAAARAGDGDR